MKSFELTFKDVDGEKLLLIDEGPTLLDVIKTLKEAGWDTDLITNVEALPNWSIKTKNQPSWPTKMGARNDKFKKNNFPIKPQRRTETGVKNSD